MKAVVTVKFKRCAGCGYVKEHTAFRKNVRSRDGLEYRCRVCRDDLPKFDGTTYKRVKRATDPEFRRKEHEYHVRYREKTRSPASRERHRRWQAARRAAVKRMTDMFPDVYETFLLEERRKRGLTDKYQSKDN